MKLRAAILAAGLAVAAIPLAVFATDPPHDDTFGVECMDCHDPHSAAGGALNIAETNPNVCMTCHNPTGLAAARPFNDADQALPGISGTSHRFDSGPSGHAEPDPSNLSTGQIRSGGTFTGRVERVYSLSITGDGNLGTATFDWLDDAGNSGSGTASTSAPLSDGITARFENGASSPSFITGDSWTIYVRVDLVLPDPGTPAEEELAIRLSDYDKVECSTCHNQHSQEKTPADPDAPAYTGTGTGWGRHYQREDNDTNQMCLICHAPRDVQSSADGSHPVGVSIPGTSDFQTPTGLNLIGGQVYCTTCHSPHFTDSGGANGGLGDGYLLNDAIGDLCLNCHTLADTASGSHFDPASGALWPGGQYGSSAPAHPSSYQGYCVNCHWPHGWPDDDDLSADYPRLWLEQYDIDRTGMTDPDDAEDLCFTCHDGSPATSDLQGDFTKAANTTEIYHHPVMDSEQSAGRTAECLDCHDPHHATNADRHANIDGVDIDGNPITAGSRQLEQYELCFKCHGDTYNSSRSMTSNKRLDFAAGNSAYHPVLQAGRNQSTNLANQLLGGLTTSSTIQCSDCHASSDLSATTGTITDSASVTVGPHGSSYAPILRANLNRDYTSGPSSYSATNYALCFGCHDETALMARSTGDGASTNFYDDINGKDNLHWVHLDDRAGSATAVCSNCHFDIHSNISADNTQYRIDGVLYNDNAEVSAAGIKTHMVNFSPDVTAYSGDGTSRAKPEWELDTSTRVRWCYLTCHGETMGEGGGGTKEATYRVASGDETAWTYAVTCTDGDSDTYFSQLACNDPADCNDGDPLVNPGVLEGVSGLCNNGVDDDCDGLSDCDDDECAGIDGCPSCSAEDTEAACSDLVDNDCDKLVDCDDPDCSATAACALPEDGSSLCSNGSDDDSDSLIDCHDDSCWTSTTASGTCDANGSGPEGAACCTDGDGDDYACYRAECDGLPCDRRPGGRADDCDFW